MFKSLTKNFEEKGNNGGREEREQSIERKKKKNPKFYIPCSDGRK